MEISLPIIFRFSAAQCKRYIPTLCLSRCNATTTGSETFKFSDLQIETIPPSKKAPKSDPKKIKFGSIYTDHMFEVEWTRTDGWGIPRIVPIHNFQLHPGSKVLHYAQGVFEGLKAFKYSDGTAALFRPEKNMERLLLSCKRAELPLFAPGELLKCLKKLVAIEKDWIPDVEGCSLYVRPTAIGVEENLGVQASNKTLLYILTCPVGPYFTAGEEKPVSLLADPLFVRAWPGGIGDRKMASNYAPTLYVQRIAQEQGLQQVLWLMGKDLQITEVGAMNVFFVLKQTNGEIELVTPPLDGTILPGIVRQSILDLAREWKEFTVSERPINMHEIIAANKEGRLLEMFGSGTAVSVCPVSKVRFLNEDINVPTTQHDSPLYRRFLKTLTDIQYGRIASDWSVPVE
ncbi:branched-chain-amino-acid aminotransferase, cytosolic-like [Stegodyphus dumicola]|uniref:branched-chain-amino-acid aminotransferase, cytosolic-like n=1 Tax=Stegodyphus dumicola TaxID=202533 RepID=UPI0015AB3A58|nr:branched-chain-amino-acid aminotransferase, cytosolic-like [Stegodyphus dumicola]